MGRELPRRGRDVAMVTTSLTQKKESVAMITTSPFPEEIGESFPNEEEDGGGSFPEEGVVWP